MRYIFIFSLFLLLFASCKKDTEVRETQSGQAGNGHESYKSTPYFFNYPFFWSSYPIQVPDNNPMTVEGVALGRKLFYDPILSQNNTMSCSSCHNISFAFSDNGKDFSDG